MMEYGWFVFFFLVLFLFYEALSPGLFGYVRVDLQIKGCMERCTLLV